MKLKSLGLLLLLGVLGCSKDIQKTSNPFTGSETPLYSLKGREYHVEFQAVYRSAYRQVKDIRLNSLLSEIKDTTQFLFGPLTYRKLGGIQKGEQIQALTEQAYVENDRVVIPYHYQATWLLQDDAVSENILQLPLPYSVRNLETLHWKACTDSQAGHNTWGFFWYYWDPERLGCDHTPDSQYQMISIKISDETTQTKLSFPEYPRLIHNENGVPTLAMTFAFGYIEDKASPNPFLDTDYGMIQFQKFYGHAKKQLLSLGFTEQSLYQSDVTEGSALIGSQFVGIKEGVKVRVSILAAAGVDQMDLFADSYAKKHEGFFGWFGHSRVGSGFDADNFAAKLKFMPEQFSLTPDYQLIYWAGCNSYSYYTLPFFELKSKMNPEADPKGTQNLDLISNALPSLFSFNDYNAQILFHALLNWNSPTSYQSLINQIENFASSSGYKVMANVLGDEDNP